MKKKLYVPAGGLFYFSSGEKGGYSYDGHFIAIEALSKTLFDAVIDDIKERCASGDILDYRGEKIDLSAKYQPGSVLRDNFVPTLIRTGKIIAIDCVEIYTGSYRGNLHWII